MSLVHQINKSPAKIVAKRSIEITRSEVSKTSPGKSRQNQKLQDQEKVDTLQTFQEMEDYNGFAPESPPKQSPRGEEVVTNFFSQAKDIEITQVEKVKDTEMSYLEKEMEKQSPSELNKVKFKSSKTNKARSNLSLNMDNI